MLTRCIASIAILSALACAKAAPEVSEQRLQPLPEAARASATSDTHAALSSESLPKVSVDEVAALIEAKQAQPVDANGADTRKEYGTLPGAVLLTNYRSFDLSELPADKSKELVFYCGGEACTAAPKPAERAKEAGYTSVKVMSAGITGWVKARKPVDKLDV
jgi:rhodanese-related sulfurtransferase